MFVHFDKFYNDTFNSIKVQLSRLTRYINKDSIIFQFHKGTIKPVQEAKNKLELEGTFNSIKVQLSRSMCFALLSLMVFQFHKGTIKPDRYHSPSIISLTFNSIKVQLSPGFSQYIQVYCRLSIP